MKDLSRHIEYLLCEHDSVAIPGIGVFVTEELPARYYPEEGLFLPPVRSVRLDTSDKTDDHKLEDCLIQLHHVTHNIAQKWIAEYIDDINQSLMDMGIMDMGTIGRLVATEDGITFEVCESGVNSPELYGLDSFHISKLPAYAHRNESNTDRTHLTIRLRRSTVHRVMTAAAMLIVALTVIVPNYGSFDNIGLQAKLNTAESLANIFASTTQPISYPLADAADVQESKEESQTVASNLDTIVTELILNDRKEASLSEVNTDNNTDEKNAIGVSASQKFQDITVANASTVAPTAEKAVVETEATKSRIAENAHKVENAQANSTVRTQAETTTKENIAAKTEAEAKAKIKTETKVETKAEAKAEVKDETKAEVKTTSKAEAKAIPATTATAKTTEVKHTAASLQAKGFCIVMASAITEKGADHLIAKLNKEGFTNAVKHKDKDMLRVLLTGYENETAARSHMATVKAADKLYSGSWIKKF